MEGSSPRYLDLGNLLTRWRGETFSTREAFLAEKKPSIAAERYAELEGGAELATPAELEELARLCGRDAREALVVWAEVQMVSDAARLFFARAAQDLEVKADEVAPAVGRIESNNIPKSEHADTWVFNDRDREQLMKFPWLLDFLVGLATVYPTEITFEQYGFERITERELFVERYLKRWVIEGRILVSDTGFKLRRRHVHMPKNEAWQPVRDGFLGRVLEAVLPMMTPELIAAQHAHRTHLHKVLTDEQREYWVKRFAELEMELSLTPNVASEQGVAGRTYNVMVLIAPRELGLPKHITQVPKKPFAA